MLMPRIIPCLDVRDGRVVKGVKFQGLRDAGDPTELSARYESEGADELVVLDVSATVDGRIAMLQTVEQVRRQLSIPLTVGGGIKTVDDAERLLQAGADKVSINSAAVQRPDLVDEMSQRFGAQCTVVAIDAFLAEEEQAKWQIRTRSGTEKITLDAIAWGQEVQRRGAGEILLTSWDRDGTREGYDLPLMRAFTDKVSIPVIASGGADQAIHLKEAFQAGAHAVLAASIFHDRDSTVAAVKQELQNLGINVRL